MPTAFKKTMFPLMWLALGFIGYGWVLFVVHGPPTRSPSFVIWVVIANVPLIGYQLASLRWNLIIDLLKRLGYDPDTDKVKNALAVLAIVCMASLFDNNTLKESAYPSAPDLAANLVGGETELLVDPGELVLHSVTFLNKGLASWGRDANPQAILHFLGNHGEIHDQKAGPFDFTPPHIPWGLPKRLLVQSPTFIHTRDQADFLFRINVPRSALPGKDDSQLVFQLGVGTDWVRPRWGANPTVILTIRIKPPGTRDALRKLSKAIPPSPLPPGESPPIWRLVAGGYGIDLDASKYAFSSTGATNSPPSAYQLPLSPGIYRVRVVAGAWSAWPSDRIAPERPWSTGIVAALEKEKSFRAVGQEEKLLGFASMDAALQSTPGVSGEVFIVQRPDTLLLWMYDPYPQSKQKRGSVRVVVERLASKAPSPLIYKLQPVAPEPAAPQPLKPKPIAPEPKPQPFTPEPATP